MKPRCYSDYMMEDTIRAESALLTAWAILREFRDDLVLVGGLVPRYLCQPRPSELQAVTMDVDLGISLGLCAGLYETTRNRLIKAGFEWDSKENRFVREYKKNNRLFLDFLTDKPRPEADDSVTVDDIPVSAQPGVQRALEVCREVRIGGHDLHGAEVEEAVRVCEAGPYICLKLLAYHNRAKGKDVFDMVRCVRDYDRGSSEAVRLFSLEAGVNPAHAAAMCVLKERFTSDRAKGPVQYAEFCLGERMAGPGPGPTEPTNVGGMMQTSSTGPAYDEAFLRKQRANEAVDVANLLLGGR